jgi:hypothetical protein
MLVFVMLFVTTTIGIVTLVFVVMMLVTTAIGIVTLVFVVVMIVFVTEKLFG